MKIKELILRLYVLLKYNFKNVAIYISQFILGIIAVIYGIKLITINFIFSFIIFIWGIIIIPPIAIYLESKTKLSSKFRLKIILLIIALMLGSIINANYSNKKLEKKFLKNKLTIIQNINKKIDLEKYDEALEIIKKYEFIKNNDLVQKKILIIEKKLKKIPYKNIKENKYWYSILVSLDSENQFYKDKLTYYTKLLEKNNVKSTNNNKETPKKIIIKDKVFIESDFFFDKKTQKYKDVIITGVNRIYQENEDCEKIEPATANLSSQNKGTKNDPYFFVTCYKNDIPFNIYFLKSEIDNNKKFIKIENISKNKAFDLCKHYVKFNVNHPSTLKMSIWNSLIINYPNGKTILSTSFKSKNSFGLELKNEVKCWFEGHDFITGEIW